MMKLLSLLAAAQALIGNNCLATPITATDQVDINSSAAELEKRGDLNFNEVVLGQCKNVIAIYAKGTSLDPNKNNYDAVGSAWFSNIVKQEGGAKYVVRQGVNYVADIPGAVFGNVEGGTELFRLIKQARSKCPSGKIVLGGYSQGAQIIHRAMNDFGPDSDSHAVVAITLFGDPNFGYPKDTVPVANVNPSIVKRYCHSDDSICHHSLDPGAGHQTYPKDCPAAAKWIHAKVAAAGRSNDK